MYSKSLDKYFVSDAMRIDNGLACLFGFENDGIEKLKDYVLSSEKFIHEIKEEWWSGDWTHVANLQCIGIKDENNIEMTEHDLISVKDNKSTFFGDIAKIVYIRGAFVLQSIDFEDGRYEHFKMSMQKNEYRIAGNPYENKELSKDGK